MQYRKTSPPLKKLLMGFFLRCPNCEQGHISHGLFHVAEICDVCAVRFERAEGEYTGAMMTALSVVSVLAIAVFIVMEILFHPPLAIQLGAPLTVVFVTGVLMYRNWRGLWIGVVYLTGNVYADADAEQLGKKKDEAPRKYF